MGKHKRRDPSLAEQHVLEHCYLRLLTCPEDAARRDQLIVEHHYLHDVTLVGEHLRYAFIYRGQWLAVATWSSAAFHLNDRDRFIGWTPEQCRRRRGLLANNSRLLALPDCHYANLISHCIRLMLDRLSSGCRHRTGRRRASRCSRGRSRRPQRRCLAILRQRVGWPRVKRWRPASPP